MMTRTNLPADLIARRAVVEDSANQLHLVRETGNPDLAHVWFGIAAKAAKGGGYTPRANAREILVRKKGCRLIRQAAEA